MNLKFDHHYAFVSPVDMSVTLMKITREFCGYDGIKDQNKILQADNGEWSDISMQDFNAMGLKYLDDLGIPWAELHPLDAATELLRHFCDDLKVTKKRQFVDGWPDLIKKLEQHFDDLEARL